MCVCDQYLMEIRSCQRGADFREVSALACAGVNQGRDRAGDEPRPVAVAGDRPRVEREDRNRVQKNTFNRA